MHLKYTGQVKKRRIPKPSILLAEWSLLGRIVFLAPDIHCSDTVRKVIQLGGATVARCGVVSTILENFFSGVPRNGRAPPAPILMDNV